MSVRLRGERDPDFYSAGGWGYTDRQGDAERVADWIDEFRLTGDRVLDAGCGDGWWSSLFTAAGYDVVAVDRSPDAIKVAERDHPGPSYQCGELASLIESGTLGEFDTVFVRGLSSTGVPWSPTAGLEMALLAGLLTPTGTLLVVRATDRTGSDSDSVVPGGGLVKNPTLAALVEMVELAADVFKVTVDGVNVAIGAHP